MVRNATHKPIAIVAFVRISSPPFERCLEVSVVGAQFTIVARYQLARGARDFRAVKKIATIRLEFRAHTDESKLLRALAKRTTWRFNSITPSCRHATVKPRPGSWPKCSACRPPRIGVRSTWSRPRTEPTSTTCRSRKRSCRSTTPSWSMKQNSTRSSHESATGSFPTGPIPVKRRGGEINHHDGGRGFYFEDPNGHLLEVITR